jgi:hypothetical protein
MTLSAETRPSNGIALFVVGGILLVAGLVGVAAYAFGIPDQASVDGGGLGVVRGVTIVGSAIAIGAGALLVTLGIVKRRSAERRDASGS